MILFSEIDGNFFALIIGAVFVGVGQLLTIYLGYKRDLATRAKVETVVTKIDTVEKKVDTVQVATDGMKEALVKAKEEAAASLGELKGRADQKAEGKEDAKAVRQEIKEAVVSLGQIQVTGEDTNKVVNEIAEISPGKPSAKK